MDEDSDGTLVRRCCNGDRRAFEALVVRYERPVYNAALRMLRDREEARDVAQTVFLKVYEHLGEYDPSHRFYSWIYRIALNESINTLQRRRPRAPLDPEMAGEEPGPDDSLSQVQLSGGLAAAVAGLRDEYRAVIVLRHYLGCSYEDMASIVGVPVKTVKSRLFSARQLLKTAMQAKGWNPE
jgi:RNA polymerase sigma-70 factor (ECF subfamily)